MSEFVRQEFKINGDIVSRSIAGEAFLIPIRGKLADMQCIYTLNPVAEFIWNQLVGRSSLEEISKRVVTVFDVEEQTAKSDIREFVEDLVKSGLVVGAR